MNETPLPVHLRDCSDRPTHDWTTCRCGCHPERAPWSVVIEGEPPSVNTSYKIVTIKGRSRLAKHSAVSTWQDTVAWLARAAKPADWQPTRRTVIEVAWFTKRAHDSDNGLKALSDGLAVGIGCDDRGFLMRVMSNELDKEKPRTEVTIRNDE